MVSLCIKDIKRKWRRVLAAALEMAVVMVLLCMFISVYYKQSEMYRPYAKLFSGVGVEYANSYYHPFEVTDGEMRITEFDNVLEDVEDVVFSVRSTGFLEDGVSRFEMLGLDDVMAGYVPELLEGEWYTESHKKGCISVVITENDYGVKCGDYIDILDYHNGEFVGYSKAYVCGIIKDGTHVYNGAGITNHPSAERLHEVYNFNVPNYKPDPIVFMSKKDMVKSFSEVGPCISIFVKYKDNISKETLAKNNEYLENMGMINDFSLIKANSLKDINREVMKIVPLLVGVLIFTTINIATVSAVVTINELPVYAIYSINGMKWSGIVKYKLIQGIITSAIGLIIFGLSSVLISKTGLHLLVEYKFYSVEILAVLLIVLYFVIVQTCIPYLCARGKKCVDILRKGRV